MGDRVNWGFVAEMGAPVINLYGHWAGSERRERLAEALQSAKPRWSDTSYATRIVISQIVGEQWNSETGWGLTVDELSDNEHPYLLVFWETKQVVDIPLDYNNTGKTGFYTAMSRIPQAQVFTFEEFIKEYATT
jgi:hypothetical protein